MERLNVNPTRMMLTTLKRRLVTARRGHKLMKDKRDQLMKGFLELARENKRLREEVEQELSRVYESFSVASAVMSQEVMEEALMFPKQGVDLSVTGKNVMSVDVPQFSFETTAEDSSDIYPYGFASTSGELDAAIAGLARALLPCWIWPPKRRRLPCWLPSWRRREEGLTPSNTSRYHSWK